MATENVIDGKELYEIVSTSRRIIAGDNMPTWAQLDPENREIWRSAASLTENAIVVKIVRSQLARVQHA